MNKLPLIEKIHLLETRLGEKCIHKTFEPIKFDSSDTIKVHEIGNKIAQHLGLPPLTFYISFVAQKANVGGNIELDSTSDVFIELDLKFKNDNDFVLAILAHEICHKYLQLNNLKLFPEYENEMLTDATTIYTGLGKLSLNGCEKVMIENHANNQIITTQKVGYMNRKQFAFVYRLVCEMRRIPKDVMLNGLTFEASNEVINSSNGNSMYFNSEHFRNDLILSEISDAMKNEISDSQKSFANFNRNIKVIQESILKSAEQHCREFHLYTKTKTDAIISTANKSFNKDAHNYIKNLHALEELKFLKSKVLEKKTEINKIGNAFPKFITYVNFNFINNKSKQDLDFLLQFDCPFCNNKMRIKENKLVRVNCTKCNYSFIVDAAIIETFNKGEGLNETITKKKSWFEKIMIRFTRMTKL